MRTGNRMVADAIAERFRKEAIGARNMACILGSRRGSKRKPNLEAERLEAYASAMDDAAKIVADAPWIDVDVPDSE